MNVKRRSSGHISSASSEPPAIDDKWIAEADQYVGKKLVKRGRPKLANPRQLLSLRLPSRVISKWKASGPGWQTRMAEVLERSMPRSRKAG